MPHKRAKFSKRQEARLATGTDLPPPSGKDDYHFASMPKGAMRILQGAKIQEDYRRRKLAADQARQSGTSSTVSVEPGSSGGAPGTGKGKANAKAKATLARSGDGADPKEDLKIRPGEKLRDFNIRVEQAMASDVHSTFRSAANAKKRARRAARKAGIDRANDGEGSDDVDAEERRRRADKAAAKEAAEPTRLDLKRQRQALESGGGGGGGSGEVKEFAKASQVKRINDVAQAPPRLTRAPRGESVQSKMRKAQLMAKMGGTDEHEASRRVLTDEKARFKGRIPDRAVGNTRAVLDDRKRKRAGGIDGDGDGDDDGGYSGARPGKPSMARQMVLDQERDKAIKLYRELKEKKLQERQPKPP